jgi:hypothetical protein
MASLPLLYVHGAGPQPPAATLKKQLDAILFGQDAATTRLAYYADVRWGRTSAERGAAASVAGPSNRAARQRAILSTATHEKTPTEAADAIIAATLEPARRRSRAAARTRGAAAGAVASPTTARDVEAARRLVERLYRQADVVASRSSVPAPGVAAGITFPDPIFRIVVGRFASDVVDYLYGPYAEAMREPVRQALLQGPPPKVIVAHSLGTIVLYDVLTEPAFSQLSVDLLVTVGCPLGIGNVQNRLRDRAGRPNPVPPSLGAWSNFADRFDPVAIDATLRDEFDPPKNFAHDAGVNNPARNNHDLTGYLSVALVRTAIVAATGP